MSRLDNTIELLDINIVKDKELNEIEEFRVVEVYCRVESITRREFYSAANSNLKPELLIKMNAFEYDGQRKVRYKNKIYNVLRSYCSKDFIELTVGEKIG